MAKNPFQLRSGNKTSFKMMGSSPVKVRPAKSDDPNKSEAYAARESGPTEGPMELKGSPHKIKGAIKREIKKDIKKDIKDEIKKDVKKDLKQDIFKGVSPDDFKTTKSGQFNKGSKGYKQVQKNMQTMLKNNPDQITKPLSWWKKGLMGLGGWEVGKGAYDVVYNVGKDFGWWGEEDETTTTTSTTNESTTGKPDHLTGGGETDLDTVKKIDETDVIQVKNK